MSALINITLRGARYGTSAALGADLTKAAERFLEIFGDSVSPKSARAWQSILDNPEYFSARGGLTEFGRRAALKARLDPNMVDEVLDQVFRSLVDHKRNTNGEGGPR